MLRKFLAGLVAVAAILAGTTPGTAQAGRRDSAPIVAPAAFGDLGTPPAPTRQDRAYKPNKRDLTARKGFPTGFTTFACPCYNYVIAEQGYAAGTTANSLAANLPTDNAFIKTTAPAEYHDLNQLALQQTVGGQDQAIEFGVTRDNALFGDWQQRLFAGVRKNGVFQGYGVGFVDYAPNVTDTYGTVVPTAAGGKRFQIVYSGGNWWLAYNLAWIGYFPGTIFSGSGITFVSGDLMRAFMESAGKNVNTCNDLGNGKLASDASAAKLDSINASGFVPSAPVQSFTASVQPVGAVGFSATSLMPQTVRGGGPGANAALTGVGTAGAC